MKTIVYTCPYVPAEWIAAHGLRPHRLVPTTGTPGTVIARAEGVCPYACGFVNEAAKGAGVAGIVVTTLCDQMRRAFEVLAATCDRPAFLMNVPNTWQSLAAQRLYRDELKRLGNFLVRLGGTAPSPTRLQKVMTEYDDARAALRAAQPYLPPRQFSEAAVATDRCAKALATSISGPLRTDGIPIALVGGPLLKTDAAIYDMISDAGGRIVLDAMETGERGLCPPFDRRALRDDSFAQLADAYFNGIHDASRRPNSAFYVWLKAQLATRDVRGIVVHRYIWCDIWHAEQRRLKDWAGVPVLEIDADDGGATSGERTCNRIRAFLEMLQ